VSSTGRGPRLGGEASDTQIALATTSLGGCGTKELAARFAIGITTVKRWCSMPEIVSGPRWPARIRDFWLLVDDSGGPNACWPWRGRLDKDGYGKLSFCGRHRRAHQVALQIGRNLIPGSGLMVRHVTCGNRPCCNYWHLDVGTNQDNCNDTITMGRTLTGEKNHKAKITAAEAAAMRTRRAAGETTKDLGDAFGITQSAASKICRGTTWRIS